MTIEKLMEGYGAFRYFGGGVFLASRETMFKEQEEWDDWDECKDFDFGPAPYWLTTDNGILPIAIYGVDDLKKYIKLEEVV